MSNPIRICIIGGGVIGASIAFHLSEAGCSHTTIVERTSIACGASGRAGGFLARPLAPQAMLVRSTIVVSEQPASDK